LFVLAAFVWWSSGVPGWQDPERLFEERERERQRELMALPVLPVRHHAPIAAADDGDVLVCASVGPAGEVIAVWSAAADLPALTTLQGLSSPRTVTARVTVHAPDIVSVIEITRLGLVNYVQPLPGGNILVVGARSRWHPEGPDRNAVVYEAGGHVLAEEVLGDGIGHVLADSTGHVWVGYYDEGVFGNYGWGHPGPPPVGACGLIRFAPDLSPAWRYPSADNPFQPIDDCYALNVDGTTAWTCYYSAFPIVRIHEGILTGWRNDIAANALAVDGSQVALRHSYYPDRSRLAVGLLQDGHFQVTGEYRLVLPGQADLPEHTQVIGRGPCLHFLTDNDWYQLIISDLPPQPCQ
jgi:hypothetical protein